MPQFRPLPRFDEVEEETPAQTPLTATTDPIAKVATTDPIPLPGMPNTHPVAPPQTSARLPIVLLSGPHPGTDTAHLATLVRKPDGTAQQLSLLSALQTSTGTPTVSTTHLLVIPAEHKRTKKRATTVKHLNPHVRQSVILLATLVIFIIALTTLVPLSDNQNGSILSGLGNWIHSTQSDWQITAQQAENQGQGNQFVAPTYLNGPGLPYMHIANSQYVPIAEQDAANAGIPPVYFVRQIQQESGFNPSAVSVTNAEGIAQFEPSTASGLGINPWDPIQALQGAAKLMSRYYQRYGNYAKALGAYNAGSGAVSNATSACGGNWLSCMPGQTQNYVYRIMGA